MGVEFLTAGSASTFLPQTPVSEVKRKADVLKALRISCIAPNVWP
ncbi:hypothetical protein PC129_g24453 [Phytophthora cactorum]|uniref:Uncharacterized protein n=1 Tax=Phytophthora cactorum TaxID=29920 RepID=A0A8T1GS16_9STRA|nr:hypothetical protein PC128_g27105 [Phytophthora cactorum]KAG3197941.1 hypothetical protein PC129_g24453 [Phytophthora cactorum]